MWTMSRAPKVERPCRGKFGKALRALDRTRPGQGDMCNEATAFPLEGGLPGAAELQGRFVLAGEEEREGLKACFACLGNASHQEPGAISMSLKGIFDRKADLCMG